MNTYHYIYNVFPQSKYIINTYHNICNMFPQSKCVSVDTKR